MSATASTPEYEIKVIGAEPTPLRDLYHALLGLSWPATLGVIALGWLAINAIFAALYLASGGVAHAGEGSFSDAFFFSVQTMGTVGYGTMYPESKVANVIVSIESVVGLLVTALVTGIVFAKFSRPSARVIFSRHLAIGRMNGVPTLAFRLGNQRGNRIVDAQVRMAFVRTEITDEGSTFYRMVDLPLVRERILSLSRSWNVLHVIDEKSPLYGLDAKAMEKLEGEFLVTMSGTDDTWMQTVHALHRYHHRAVAWGSRLADVLSEEPGGAIVLDLRKFHDIEAA